MRRQLFTETSISRLAIWSRRIALFSLAATFIAVIIVRSGALEIVPALSTLAGALMLACLAILLAFAAGIVIWRQGVGGGRQAVAALLMVDARPPQGPLPRVIDARAPQPSAVRDGIIEAVARTPILGFRDDVVVRIRPTIDGARIDVRSASRYGRHDLGTNAKRVRSLIED